MCIELTPHEIELAGSAIDRYERGNNQWRKVRYIQLIISIGMILCSLYLLWSFFDLYQYESPPKIIEQTDLPGGASTKAYEEITVNLPRAIFTLIIPAVLLACVGTVLLVNCLLRWNRNIYRSIFGKIIRLKLQNTGKIEEIEEDK